MFILFFRSLFFFSLSLSLFALFRSNLLLYASELIVFIVKNHKSIKIHHFQKEIELFLWTRRTKTHTEFLASTFTYRCGHTVAVHCSTIAICYIVVFSLQNSNTPEQHSTRGKIICYEKNEARFDQAYQSVWHCCFCRRHYFDGNNEYGE